MIGTSLTVSGVPVSMTGSVNGADFEASGSIGGMVTGTYAISGSFTTADDWNGTFTITFIGDTEILSPKHP